MSWSLFTNDDEDPSGEPPMAHLLPSSLRDVWDDPAAPPRGTLFTSSSGAHRPAPIFAIPDSAPPNGGLGEVTFRGEVETGSRSRIAPYYEVEFHPNRSAIFQGSPKLRLSGGDYVLTEADRGVDVGRVVSVLMNPSFRETKGAKLILRLATQSEVRQLPQKAEREARALQLGQAKVAESGLPMVITGAEFQFDGKKLTFYYSASTYIDFRVLVRNLFKVFGTRIWMVCNEGSEQERGGRGEQ
jgi:hypothetical protein